MAHYIWLSDDSGGEFSSLFSTYRFRGAGAGELISRREAKTSLLVILQKSDLKIDGCLMHSINIPRSRRKPTRLNPTPTWMICDLESLSSMPMKKFITSWEPYFTFSLAMTSSSRHNLPEEKRRRGDAERRKVLMRGSAMMAHGSKGTLYRIWPPSCPRQWANRTHQAAWRAEGPLLSSQFHLTHLYNNHYVNYTQKLELKLKGDKKKQTSAHSSLWLISELSKH